jgi:hypothetical protein
MILLEANDRNSCTWTDILVHFRDLQREQCLYYVFSMILMKGLILACKGEAASSEVFPTLMPNPP